MNNAEQLAEFVNLWHKVQQIQLTDQEDTIRWKWTSTGKYSARSVYLMQFQGSHSEIATQQLWSAKAEGKQKLHAWTALQGKVLTADALIKRNWPCNTMCPLCDQEDETIAHITINCSYAKQVWNVMSRREQAVLLSQTDWR